MSESPEADAALVSLAHDLGKYIARIARNVPAGAAVPPALLPLFVKDLYETHQGRRASAVWNERRGALARRPELEVIEACLAELDTLEVRVRAAEADATAQAADLARAVSDLFLKIVRGNAS